MKIEINLATKPFVELRPILLRLRVVMAVLLVAGIGMAVAAHVMQRKLDTAQAQMSALEKKTDAARQEKANNEKRMRTSDNAAVLERAHFLNALFLRKSFSWTAVMMDLENVLPTGVQITAIEPQIASDGEVTIRLRVGGDRDRAVLLVRNLERSKRFLRPRLTGEATQTKEGTAQGQPAAAGPPPGVEFEILADYNPLPEGESYKVAKAEEAEAKTSAAKPAGAKSAKDGIVLKPFAPKASPVMPKASPAKPASTKGGAL